jgi:cobalamin biosynthesis protein CobD/CbiB
VPAVAAVAVAAVAAVAVAVVAVVAVAAVAATKEFLLFLGGLAQPLLLAFSMAFPSMESQTEECEEVSREATGRNALSFLKKRTRDPIPSSLQQEWDMACNQNSRETPFLFR